MSAQDQAKQDVQLALDEATRRIREQSDRFHKVAMPVAYRVRDFADNRPVFFTFMVIFVGFSAIPTLCFVGFVLTATAFILGTAAVLISLSILTTFLIGASILLPILAFTTFASLATLTFLLTLFLFHRLYIHLSQSTRSPETGDLLLNIDTISMGLKSWADETRTRIDLMFPSIPVNLPTIPSVHVPSQFRFQPSNLRGSGVGDEAEAGIKKEEDYETDQGHGLEQVKIPLPPAMVSQAQVQVQEQANRVTSQTVTPLAKRGMNTLEDVVSGSVTSSMDSSSPGSNRWVTKDKFESDGLSDSPSDWSESNPIPSGPV